MTNALIECAHVSLEPPLLARGSRLSVPRPADGVEDELARCRKDAEETRQRLFDFLSTASDVIWETDAEMQITVRHEPGYPESKDHSPGNDFMFGRTFEEIVGGNPDDDPVLSAHFEDVRARRPFRGFVHRFQRPDGTVGWFEANGKPVFAPDGTFLGYRGTSRDITQRKAAEARIAFLARHDTLTSLPNRILFRERLEQSLAESRGGRTVAVLMLDVDNFKLINDSIGHRCGDNVLRAIGERLAGCGRATDTVARVGGDEFALVQVDVADASEAIAFANRITDAIAEPYEIDGHRVTLTVSIGIALASGHGASPDPLMRNADIALSQARLEGPGARRFFESEMGLAFETRRALDAELRNALANREFELFYQPFYNVQCRRICAFEALLRWRHPVRGLVAPDRFIPLAEETGLIVPISEWVLQEACAEAARWPPDINVSVNLSPVQFRNRTPLTPVLNALNASGLAPARLELEITETLLMQNSETTISALHQLRELGCRISMDDFGTGYSSLSYLRGFPFDKIKIDRSFIQDMTEKQGGIAIVRAIAALGSSLRLATTAEGVETMEQFVIVRAEGCTEVQGYFFSAPVPAAQIPELLETAAQRADFQRPESVVRAKPSPESLLVNMPAHGDVLQGKPV